MYMMPKSTEKTSKSTLKKKKIKAIPGAGNPWTYRETLYTIKETDALSIEDILQLDCRDKYKVRPNSFVVDGSTAKDEMFRMFREMMGQDVRFMRQWVRCFVLTHRRFIMKLAKTHLTEHSLSLPRWLKALTNGCRADTLCLYILSIMTETHCFVHIKNGIWTTLGEIPHTHAEYSQRCNLHLSYMGNDTYAQHEIRTQTVAYDVFGLPEPLTVDLQVSTEIIGTCTSEETETLNQLLRLGITSQTPDTQTIVKKPTVEATATISTLPDPKLSTSTLTKTYTTGESTELSSNKPEESATETATFLRSLDLVPTHADLDEHHHLVIPSPPGLPALPEGDETASPTMPTDLSDDTIILPVEESQVPQYIIQQQKLIKHELIVKIMKLSDSDINSHLKTTQPPTAHKCKGITLVKK